MNVWLTVTNRFLEKRESNKQLINFLEIWHSWHEVMLNYVFSNYSILFYKMREQCLQLFLIMLLPVLYYEGLIHQTKNFICIHSSLFFFVPQERKAALIWKIWKYEKHWQSTFTVQPDAVCQVSHVSPQDITSHIIHQVISHTRGASNVWMLADDCVVQTKASFLRLAMWYHKVPWGHCCPSACFTLKLATLLHQHLEVLLTERD